ncbi:MAG: hypothetical protein ABFD97_19700 [Syntrophobacter sp.]
MKLGFKLLKLLCLVVCLAVLGGCVDGSLSLPKMDFSNTWVSKDGKPKEQLSEDMRECSRDARMASPPAFSGEVSHGGGGDMKVFDSCMRAKGWIKEK